MRVFLTVCLNRQSGKADYGFANLFNVLKPVYRRASFTLIELLAAMGVLTIIMFVLISFFASAQKAWTMSNARAETYENARIALDLITRDLQSIYYVQNKIPFWHGAYASAGWNEYRSNDIIAFVSATSSPPNDLCVSRLCELKYQKYYAETHSNSNDGWLRRSCTGDDGGTNTKWNFHGNFNVGYTGAANVFTANSLSSEDFQKIIPHVVELSFICYRKDGSIIPKNTTFGAPSLTTFPYAVTVFLTLMDKASWDKWCALDDDPYHPSTVLTAASQGTDENNAAWEFRKNTQRTFIKTVFIGDRGQRY